MSEQSPQQEKKIFVDENWKEQVEAEREALRQLEEQGPEAGRAAPSQARPLPPPDLTFLATNVYLQGLMALGLMADPASEKVEVRLDLARHTIDILAMLQQKTEGNRTPEETQALENMLHELRLAFIQVQQMAAAAAPQAQSQPSGDAPR